MREESEQDRYLRDFELLWRRAEYFEAHECLEEAWNAAGRPRGGWLQAGILAAVAMAHHERGNRPGAERVARRAWGLVGEAPDSLKHAPPTIAQAVRKAYEAICARS